MPPAGRGTRGKLKFQPKSGVRRSKEERDAAEKKEQAAIKAEEAAIEREKQRAEARAARGRGRGGSRGGLARGGVSGWMNDRGDVGFLSGAMGESSSSRGPALPSGGAGTASGEYISRISGIAGGDDARSGGRGSKAVKSEDSFPVRTRDMPLRSDGRPARLINIEHINLISDDEDEEGDDDGAASADKKGKGRARPPRRGLAPVRAAREPHVPRQMRVNIDLDSSDDVKSKVRKTTTEVPREATTQGTDGTIPKMETPVKVEQEADQPEQEAGQPELKIEQVEPEPETPSRRRSARAKGKQKAELKVEQSSASQPALEPEAEPEPQQTPQKTRTPGPRRALNELRTPQAAERPHFVHPDCNFISAPRPPGWDSKDDIDNWERNVKKSYAIYEELSFPEKMKLTTDENDHAQTAGTTTAPDVEMTDAGTATEDKTNVQDSASDRKHNLVYLFQLPPGVPSIEGLRTKEDIEKAKKASQDDDVMEISETTASPKTSRSKSPEASRKKKSTAQPSATQPRIKEEDDNNPKVKVEKEEGTAASGAISIDDLPNEEDVKSGKRAPGRERPGYIGDLVVYNTGEVTMDWGGLPLQLKIGQQTNMLQQVLLTSAPITRAAAIAAEEREEKEAKRSIKKEQQQQQTGADASSAMDVDQPNESTAGASAAAAAKSKPELEEAFALGSLAGVFTAIPNFQKLFGSKWT